VADSQALKADLIKKLQLKWPFAIFFTSASSSGKTQTL
jgi:hypothetical protein